MATAIHLQGTLIKTALCVGIQLNIITFTKIILCDYRRILRENLLKVSFVKVFYFV
jgi:hypothetical protein